MINLRLELEGEGKPETILFVYEVEKLTPEELHIEISGTIEKAIRDSKDLEPKWRVL